MADPLRKPSEMDFGVEPFAEPALPENTTTIPGIEPRERDRRFVHAAESVGSTLGSAVGSIRGKMHSGLEVVRKRSTEKGATIDDLTGKVRDRADQVRDAASRRLRQWSDGAQHRIRILRARTQELSRERPAEMILAIGGVAMIAGIILRLWRSSRD